MLRNPSPAAWASASPHSPSRTAVALSQVGQRKSAIDVPVLNDSRFGRFRDPEEAAKTMGRTSGFTVDWPVRIPVEDGRTLIAERVADGGPPRVRRGHRRWRSMGQGGRCRLHLDIRAHSTSRRCNRRVTAASGKQDSRSRRPRRPSEARCQRRRRTWNCRARVVRPGMILRASYW